MTKAEANQFRAVLTAKVAELERLTRHRDGIAVERWRRYARYALGVDDVWNSVLQR